MNGYDIAIVGAGMAGASLAAEAAPHASILLLEAEDRPGYHSTGRSAAFWAESYGGPLIQPLTTASGPFLAGHGFLRPRGALHLADREGEEALAAMRREAVKVSLEPLGRAALEGLVPGLRAGWRSGLFEESCADIDVASLHAFYLKAARRAGAELRCGARLSAAAAGSGGWRLATGAGEFEAGILVDAAGAWADEVAVRAGIPPL